MLKKYPKVLYNLSSILYTDNSCFLILTSVPFSVFSAAKHTKEECPVRHWSLDTYRWQTLENWAMFQLHIKSCLSSAWHFGMQQKTTALQHRSYRSCRNSGCCPVASCGWVWGVWRSSLYPSRSPSRCCRWGVCGCGSSTCARHRPSRRSARFYPHCPQRLSDG